jgi:hypothetical protein
LFLFFLQVVPGSLCAQYAATPEQAKVIDAWIQRTKDKLPKWLKGVPHYRLVDKNPSFYRPWGGAKSPEEAASLGIPTASDKDKLASIQVARLGKRTLLYAQYGASAKEASQQLFLKDVKGRPKRLFHLGLCSDFSVIQLGPKAPLWVLAHDSDCGRGSTDYIHELGKDGKLRLLLKLEGRGNRWRAIDLDGNGFKEVIHSAGEEGFPSDLRKALEKKGIHKAPKGPVLRKVRILQWKGGEFRKVGEYYERGEAW